MSTGAGRAVGIVSTSVSSSIPRPQSDNVTRRLAFVTAFMTALPKSPRMSFLLTTPVSASVRPSDVRASTLTMIHSS